MHKANMHHLPEEINIMILLKLPIKDAGIMAMTCRKYRDIWELEYFWKMVYKLRYFYSIDIDHYYKHHTLRHYVRDVLAMLANMNNEKEILRKFGNYIAKAPHIYAEDVNVMLELVRKREPDIEGLEKELQLVASKVLIEKYIEDGNEIGIKKMISQGTMGALYVLRESIDSSLEDPDCVKFILDCADFIPISTSGEDRSWFGYIRFVATSCENEESKEHFNQYLRQQGIVFSPYRRY